MVIRNWLLLPRRQFKLELEFKLESSDDVYPLERASVKG